MGRNKEITDDHSLRRQASESLAKSRIGTSKGKAKPGDYGTGKKVVTRPPLSV